jgi:hypothetical protein
MARSNFGTGTLYYGKRDFGADGSYITTRFFTVFWIPVIPLSSLRVKRIGMDGTIRPLPGIVTNYTVFSESAPNVKQVFSVYGFAALLAGLTVAYSHGADNFPHIALEILVVGALAGIASLSTLPALLRRRAKKKLNGKPS